MLKDKRKTYPQFLQANLSTRGSGPMKLIRELNVGEAALQLTVSDSVTFVAAVVARDFWLLRSMLNSLLGTAFGRMTELATIIAFRKASVNDHSCILQAR